MKAKIVQTRVRKNLDEFKWIWTKVQTNVNGYRWEGRQTYDQEWRGVDEDERVWISAQTKAKEYRWGWMDTDKYANKGKWVHMKDGERVSKRGRRQMWIGIKK